MLSLSQSVSTRSASTIVVDDYLDIYCAVEDSDNILNLPTTNLNQFNYHTKFKKYRKRSETENEFIKPPSIENIIHSSLKPKKQNTKMQNNNLLLSYNTSNKPFIFPLTNKKLPKKPLMTKNNRGRSALSNKPIDKIKRRRKKTLERKSNPIIQKTDSFHKLKTNTQMTRNENISNENNQFVWFPQENNYRQPMDPSNIFSDYQIIDDDNSYCSNDTILY